MIEKHKKGGLNWGFQKLKQYDKFGYTGSFELILLQSTLQGDFASLKRGLNSLIKNFDYTITMTTVNVFLRLNHNLVSQSINKYE